MIRLPLQGLLRLCGHCVCLSVSSPDWVLERTEVGALGRRAKRSLDTQSRVFGHTKFWSLATADTNYVPIHRLINTSSYFASRGRMKPRIRRSDSRYRDEHHLRRGRRSCLTPARTAWITPGAQNPGGRGSRRRRSLFAALL
ncbi:hypothetical protein EVAR_53700_1 [Eumeta japonica]|uniref:Secreted protein n=1 Tax=Eumeta variegata TaxID=151549 RepID=A0A4C1ZDJ2_EUMVA|nr:hypothetical protein EVAR_53700_1 [Eumeta japonica]